MELCKSYCNQKKKKKKLIKSKLSAQDLARTQWRKGRGICLQILSFQSTFPRSPPPLFFFLLNQIIFHILFYTTKIYSSENSNPWYSKKTVRIPPLNSYHLRALSQGNRTSNCLRLSIPLLHIVSHFPCLQIVQYCFESFMEKHLVLWKKNEKSQALLKW